MNPGKRNWLISVSRATAPVAMLGIIAAVLLLFPPTQYSFYPQCPIYRYFRIQCPGCGTTRAIAALLRGHLLEALRLNALTTLLMPIAVVYVTISYHRFLQRKPLYLPQPSAALTYSVLAVAIIFTVARNLGSI